MQKQLNQLIEFQETFKHVVSWEGLKRGLTNVDPDYFLARQQWLLEEVGELSEAYQEKDAEKILDALADILYITFGTVVALGAQNIMEKAFDAVHESNMSKLDENGKPIFRHDGKVMKGPNYFLPQLKHLLDIPPVITDQPTTGEAKSELL